MTVRLDRVDQASLREFLALFHRYGIDKSQLRVFDRPEHARWFRSPTAYRHEDVFGEP